MPERTASLALGSSSAAAGYTGSPRSSCRTVEGGSKGRIVCRIAGGHEIAVNQGRADRDLGLAIGSRVEIVS
jgi:hypothetical protein